MENQAIAGWRIRSRTAQGCHIPCPIDGYRSITIPMDAIGTLTEDVSWYSEGINDEECQLFAMDAERIKQALIKNILPDQDYTRGNYWQQTEHLTGEDLLASRTALTIKWDGIYEQEPGTINCANYIPWLELLEDADLIVVD